MKKRRLTDYEIADAIAERDIVALYEGVDVRPSGRSPIRVQRTFRVARAAVKEVREGRHVYQSEIETILAGIKSELK